MTFPACRSLSRKEVEAAIWLTNFPLPADVCAKDPAISRYGFYRRLNDGRLEFFSICNPATDKWVGIYGPQLTDLLDKYLPEPPQQDQ